jgi:hypothetical protein
MDKKPLDIETLRIRIGRKLYEDTFKENGGPGWLTIPADVRDGFIRMVGVMFNELFEEDPVRLAEFFVDEGLNKEEFDSIIMHARQQGKTFRTMQQQNAFVQRSALFTLCEAMLQDLYNIVEDTPAATEPILAQFGEYAAALEQIKDAADPAKMKAKAMLVTADEVGDWKPGDAQSEKPLSGILGADGKPMVVK